MNRWHDLGSFWVISVSFSPRRAPVTIFGALRRGYNIRVTIPAGVTIPRLQYSRVTMLGLQ